MQMFIFSHPMVMCLIFHQDQHHLTFAYRIHTDLGHKTTGAIVNGKIVTLNYQLKTGDIVEIKSSRNRLAQVKIG